MTQASTGTDELIVVKRIEKQIKDLTNTRKHAVLDFVKGRIKAPEMPPFEKDNSHRLVNADHHG